MCYLQLNRIECYIHYRFVAMFNRIMFYIHFSGKFWSVLTFILCVSDCNSSFNQFDIIFFNWTGIVLLEVKMGLVAQ